MQANDSSTRDADREASADDQDSPVHYRIRVKGHLDARWTAWFDALSLTHDSDGTTTIHGPVVDQAALHGVLQRLRDVAVPLLSVTQVDPTHPDAPVIDPR
jgi:hypothetical protein